MAIYATGTQAVNVQPIVEQRDIMEDFSPFDSLDNAIGAVSRKIDAQIEDIGNLIDADFNAY